MINIKQKSGIFTWNEENIKNTPNEIGVYILRSTPVSGSIIYIKESEALRDSLLKIYKEEDFPDVMFFDWYLTNTKDEAQKLRELIESK